MCLKRGNGHRSFVMTNEELASQGARRRLEVKNEKLGEAGGVEITPSCRE